MKSVQLVVLLLSTLSGPALAQAEATPESAPLQYTFEDELVMGGLELPDVETLVVRRRGTRASLVEVRTNYVAELLKTVEDL